MEIDYLGTLKKMAKELNSNTNISTPYFDKFKKIAGYYFRKFKIKEISVNDFHILTGINKDIALRVLIELNKKTFYNGNE